MTAAQLKQVYTICQEEDWPSIEQIARQTGMKRELVDRITRLLVRRGLLTVGYKNERLIPLPN